MYFTRGRAANNKPHEYSSLDSYLINGQMARNKVRVKGIEILSAASLLSTEIFVYTQFGEYHLKWEGCSSGVLVTHHDLTLTVSLSTRT